MLWFTWLIANPYRDYRTPGTAFFLPGGVAFCDVKFGVGNRWTIRAVGVSHALVLVVLSAYPAFAFIRGPLRQYRRRRNGLCTKCAYNLTGNVSGVCPECGGRI
jgi:hypothetical protein